MLLQDWLSKNSLTYAQFGGAISRTAEAVRRYVNGDRIPDREAMILIARETRGQVSPNDFYGLGHAPADTATPGPASPGQCGAESPSLSPSIGEAA